MKQRVLALVCLLLLAATGCRSRSGDQTIMVYSPMKGSVLGEVAREFERRTGTHVDIFYGGSGEILSRIRAERERPRGSVWVGAGGVIPFLVAKNEQLLAPYRPANFDANLGSVPPVIATHDPDWNFVAAYVLALGWAYDPDRTAVSDLPDDFQALLDPKWHHQIEIADPASSGTSTLFLEAAMQSFINRGAGEDAGWAYLRQLAPAILRFPESGGAPAVDVGKGDVALGLSFDQQAYLAKKEGAPIAFAVPRETAITMDPIAIIKGGPNLAASKTFVDFFLNREAQNIIREEGYFRLLAGVDPPPGWPYTLQDYASHAMKLDMNWLSTNFDHVRREWRERIVPNASR
jgi:iron(III) transport system substrate-binding protein